MSDIISSNQTDVYQQKENGKDQFVYSNLNVPSISGSNLSNITTKIENSKTNKKSFYDDYALNMRSKIEEKINEIEEKINNSSIGSNVENDDQESSGSEVLNIRPSHSSSISEMSQSTIDRLQSKLEKAEKDLELRDEEVSRLRKIRDEVGSEIQDLTASLFEEANNMVSAAYVKFHKAEKNAKETNMKLVMLQEEVRALKEMVQATDMNKHFCDSHETQTVSKPKREVYEVDLLFYNEFIVWRQQPNLDKVSPFMQRIYSEDIEASLLSFKNDELAQKVLSAIEENKMVIEKIKIGVQESLPKHCALMDMPRLCPYKMYLDEQSSYNISTLSRNRITAVCDLFCYFRYIQNGFITQGIHDVYLEILKKRRRITSAKLGLLDDVVE